MGGLLSLPQSPCPTHHFLTWSELFRVLPGLAKAAIMAVVVVPMLAPSVSGYALSMVITPMPGGGNTKPVTSAAVDDRRQ